MNTQKMISRGKLRTIAAALLLMIGIGIFGTTAIGVLAQTRSDYAGLRNLVNTAKMNAIVAQGTEINKKLIKEHKLLPPEIGQKPDGSRRIKSEIEVDDNGVVSYNGEEAYFSWPSDGDITSYFGYRDDAPGTTDHQGIDIDAYYGEPVRAARSGYVTEDTDWDGGYGLCVHIDHGDGMESLYGHNSELLVSPGEYVEEGDVIAYAGSTGWSSGNHVHFEVRYNGEPQNPLNFLPEV